MAEKLLTADTSAVIPFLSEWHAANVAVRDRLADVVRLPGHVLIETFSSLTRMPMGLALRPDLAAESIAAAFPGPPFLLDAAGHLALVSAAGAAGITGGAIQDALIAATAKAANALLLTRDRRAERTYRAIGVDFEMLD
ncbi:MAG: PIN domain-containing protein [Actinomycetota bacterium]|nr:PIN domain-containing protein [Actinomycetota bacterium]